MLTGLLDGSDFAVSHERTQSVNRMQSENRLQSNNQTQNENNIREIDHSPQKRNSKSRQAAYIVLTAALIVLVVVPLTLKFAQIAKIADSPTFEQPNEAEESKNQLLEYECF